MLCTACGRTDAPDMRVAGSDLVELVLWVLLLVPGLLYCGWRHLQRSRVCPHCGSAALMRESRASRHRSLQAPPAEGVASPGRRGRLVYAARHIPWMATPSQRFRRVTRGGAAAAAVGVAFAVVSLNTVRVAPNPEPAAAPRAQPTEAEVEKTREARVESLREYECERLCAEFHRAQARSHRTCMATCAAKVFDSPRIQESSGACADLLDPSACDYVSGKRPVAGDSSPPPNGGR
jgi:hypothetical protein